MATNKNITMKQFNGVDYDTLYPKTKVEQVEGAYTQQQILSDATKVLYGLGANAVPNDVLSLIKTLIDSANNNANTKAKITTGSYVGTGKSGSSNQNTLTFPFAPKVVFIGQQNGEGRGIFISASQYGDTRISPTISNAAAGSYGVALTWYGNSVSWYNGYIGECQLNASGRTYNYTAIG